MVDSAKTVTATYDGEVLRLDAPLDVEPNTRLVVVILGEPQPGCEGDVWDTLESLAGTVEGPEDRASQHDHYLYGTLKQDAATDAQTKAEVRLARCIERLGGKCGN
jgi:hypothetical protein